MAEAAALRSLKDRPYELLREWRRASRGGLPLSLLIADVDCFKPFNDNYGHQVGDECLKAVARTLEQRLRRPTDLVARYGGEEFAAILPETEAEGAVGVAEQMREGIESLGITHRFSLASNVVTISIGVASVRPSRNDEVGYTGLIKAADEALYRAKRAGRNRVVASTLNPEMETGLI